MAGEGRIGLDGVEWDGMGCEGMSSIASVGNTG